MKNNEYNIVKINNEKNNFQAEYSSSQSFEFSFQPDNDDSFKDELNSKPVVNDKVEENLSKKAKEQEEKKKEKQDSHEVEEVSSSSASSASSASGASAAGAGASAGGAIASVAAAVSVSVAAIGAIVGINVIGPAQQEDLINFLSSNLTPTSIEFEFSMNNDLLSYDEKQGSDGPIGEKFVVYQIKDSNDFYQEEFIPFVETEYENYYKYTASITGLSPNTGYALDIQIKEENPETEVPTYQLLAHRTFVTPKTEVGSLVEFVNVEPTLDSVTYQFIVDNETVNYNPDEPTTPAIEMVLYAGDEYVEEKWLGQNEYDIYSETQLICSGSFTNLQSGTTYRITVSVSLERELKYLGQTTFTTEPAPETGFQWYGGDPVAKENSIAYKYIVYADYIGYVEGETIPVVTAQVSDPNTGEVVASKDAASFIKSGNYVFVNEEVAGLTASTNYVLSIVFNSEVLGSYEFTTTERTTGFRFNEDAIIITDSTVLPRFYLKTIEIVEQEEPTGSITNINMTISGGMAYSETTNVTFRSAMEEGLSYSNDYTFEGLSPNMKYTITVTNTDTSEVYGSIEVTTEDKQYDPIGFAFDTFEKGSVSTEYNFSFHVNSSLTTDANLMSVEVIPASGGQSVYSGQISGGLSQDETLLECTGSITGLEEGTAYIAGIYYTSSDPELIGVCNFETDPNQYGFQFIQNRFVITSDSIEIAFYLNESEAQSVEGVLAVIMEVDGSEDLERIEIQFEDSGIDGKLLGTATFSGLEAQTEYLIRVYEKNGESKRYGNKTLTTTAQSTSSFTGLNDGATTFYCNVEDDTNYIFIPIKCQYNDIEEIYTNGFSLMFTLTSDPSISFTATANAVPDYRFCKITDSGMFNRLGSTFDINVYSQADPTKLIYTAYDITIKNAATDSYNYVYAGQITNTNIVNYQETAYLESEIFSVYGNTDVPSGTQIKFAKGSDYSVYYTFDIPMQYGTVSIDMVTTLAESWDSRTFVSFNDVATALSGESWDVIIIWNDGSGEQTKTIETGVTFSFSS